MKTNNVQIDLTCKNPKFFEFKGVFIYLISIVLIVVITTSQLSLLPESGKIATHWGADGIPNGWQTVSDFKLSWQLIVYGTLAFMSVIFILCYYFPSLYNKQTSRWICEKLRIVKLRNWTVSNVSILAALAVNNILLGIFFISSLQMIINVNRSLSKELPMMPMLIYILIPILFLVIFTILWEPTKSE